MNVELRYSSDLDTFTATVTSSAIIRTADQAVMAAKASRMVGGAVRAIRQSGTEREVPEVSIGFVRWLDGYSVVLREIR